MQNGWIKLHRKITEWEWYSDHNVFRLFTHLLLTANHDERKWRGATILAGQKITSYPHLAQETGLSIQNIRTSLDKLKSTGEITVQKFPHYSLVTILKWKNYQLLTATSTGEQQATNRQLTTNKNDKKDKNDKKEEEITPSQEAISFFKGEGPYEELLTLFSKGRDGPRVKREFDKFILYWTEKNKSGTRERWQTQETFEVKRRLLTWLQRANDFTSPEPKKAKIAFT